MQSHLFVSRLLIAATLAGPLCAQKGPSSEQQQAIEFRQSTVWTNFEEQAGGEWLLDYHPATGTPNAIWGPGLAIGDWRENSLEEARRHANNLLRDRSNLLGLGTSEFREVIGGRMGKTWVLVYDQYFRGLEVIDGRADVRIHEVGRVAMFGSRAFQVPANFGIVPGLLAETATAIAWQSLNQKPTGITGPSGDEQPRLVIWGNMQARSLVTPVLAWEVPVDNVDQTGGKAGRYYVDAHKGVVLHFTTSRYECAIPGSALPATTEAATAVESVVETAPYVTKTIDSITLPESGSAWTNTTITLQGYTRTGLSAVSLPLPRPLEGIEIVINGTTYTTNAAGKVTVNVSGVATLAMSGLRGTHYQSITGISAPNVGGLLFAGINQTWTFGNLVFADEEVAHPTADYWINEANEYCRNILGNTSQLNTADNIRAIVNSFALPTCSALYDDTQNRMTFSIGLGACANAAFSTVLLHEWGHGLDDRYGGITNNEGLGEGWGDVIATYVSNNPIVGDDWAGSGSYASHGNNTMQYTSITPSTPVHDAGHVFMGFAWKLRQVLAQNLPNPSQAIDISNDIVIGSIIADAQDQPDAVREIFLADDDDGNMSNGSPHRAYLIFTCGLHSLPYPSPPANDNCFGAIALSTGLNGPFSNENAGESGNNWPCGNGANDHDVWFTYTTSTPIVLDISTCGNASFDTMLQLYSGTCSSATPLACNDDACGTRSRITEPVPAGTYLIRVSGYSGANGTFSLDIGTGVAASSTPYGFGCGLTSKAFYEPFDSAVLDLNGMAMTLANNGNNYTAQPGGTFVPPSAGAVTLAMSLDDEEAVTLSGSFPYHGGTTSQLVVCSNGFVSVGYGNGTDYTPSISEWLDSTVTRWGSWHDFDAPSGGDVKFEQIGTVAYVTWDGVLSYGTNDPNTWQLQFDLATGNVTYVWDSITASGDEWLVGYASGDNDNNAGARDISVELPGTFQTNPSNSGPVELSSTAPALGTTCVLTTLDVPSTSVLAIQALSLTAHNPGINLAFLGMPGCSAYTNLDAVYTMVVAGGQATFGLPIPSQANLIGFQVFAQSSVFAPALNSFGFINSNGIALTLGN